VEKKQSVFTRLLLNGTGNGDLHHFTVAAMSEEGEVLAVDAGNIQSANRRAKMVKNLCATLKTLKVKFKPKDLAEKLESGCNQAVAKYQAQQKAEEEAAKAAADGGGEKAQEEDKARLSQADKLVALPVARQKVL
jgi:hypothetical protein